MYTDPRNGPEAKFSAEYALAVLMLSGNATLDDFTDEAAMREEVRALYPRIHRHPVDKSEGEFPTEVEVVLTDGHCYLTSVRMPVGSLASPFTPAQLWAKYDGCVAGVLSPADALALRNALENLPELADIGILTGPLKGPFAQQRQDSI
jgi:2-methylcitrate dehydratase PrpD